MRISLITVCFNSVKTIRDTLESAFSQKDVDLEYIIVDGGSTDGTVDLIREYERKPKNGLTFRWISERDRGIYDAFNKGIKMATGDIIGILNADDVFESDYTLSHIKAQFELRSTQDDGPLDAVYADIRFVRQLGGRTVRYCSAKRFRPWMFRFAVMVPHPSFYLRRELFEKYGAYCLEYKICADFELVMRYMWKHRIKTRYMEECVVVMRTGGASTSGIKSNILINKEDLKALKSNGYWSSLWLIYLKYIFKIWGFAYILKSIFH
jgi:glycosyltransferase involved in cell wall biosynthesis